MIVNQMCCRRTQSDVCCDRNHKYIVLCVLCGVLSLFIGAIIIVIYLLIRSNTSSLQYFETIPTYIPSIILISNGFIVICFAKSRTRHPFLLKTIGVFYLICALLSVIITVTTTVIHMNRLQTHSDCAYDQTNRICFCQSMFGSNADKSAVTQFLFYEVQNCGVIHGLLFTCLRALFGLSVFAILISIFSLMLVYQLLSHQKKKKYLHQLELRRRFQFQSRGLASHLSVQSNVSPHVLTHNRNHSLRHSQYCVSCEDALTLHNNWYIPPHSYDFYDNRSYNRSFEDSNTANATNRSHSWTNWLNLSRNQISMSNNQIPTNTHIRNGILDYILRRNYNNREAVRQSNNDLNSNTMRWRSSNGHNFLPPHVFIPRIGSGGLSALPPHLTRYRENRRILMTPLSAAQRRTRSNDGIFNHINPNNTPIDSLAYNTSATNGSSNVFALWGPPPPYSCSQPQSLNTINTICNNINHSVVQHCRQSSIHSTEVNSSSKRSTPISERRIRCNAFSSESIRLTIEGNNSLLNPKSKGSCIVEIHVPYNEQQNNAFNDLELNKRHKKCKLSFNTMPNIKRSDHLEPINAFNSLSNIAITFPTNQLCEQNVNCVESESNSINNELELNKSKLETIQNVYRSQIFSQNSSLSSAPNSTSNTNTSSQITSELLTDNTEESISVASFPVDPPTDYKSTLIIRTPNTQSNPITDKSSNVVAQRQVISRCRDTNVRLNSAQSMPNLSCIIPISSSKSSTSMRTNPNYWDLYRIPSSGNTSTSQDFADFELELDSEPIKFAADLPNDNMKTQLNSDSYNTENSSSETASVTPELIKPPTPFNNQNFSSTSTATISSLSNPKPELIINITGIEV